MFYIFYLTAPQAVDFPITGSLTPPDPNDPDKITIEIQDPVHKATTDKYGIIFIRGQTGGVVMQILTVIDRDVSPEEEIRCVFDDI